MFTLQEVDDLAEDMEGLFSPGTFCTVFRQDRDAREFDPETFQPLPTTDSVRYQGPCSVEATSRNYEHSYQAGDVQVTTRTYNVHIRKNPGVTINDVVKVTACPSDPELVNRPLVIIDVQWDSVQTKRILVCEDRAGY